MPGEIPIVLTASVILNVPGRGSVTNEARLREYITAVEFYQQFAPVIFLEHSGYAVEQHPEFRETDRFRVRRFQPSPFPERGKGYQEFEVLDTWISSESQPPMHWLKITGRYQILNVSSVLAECRRNANTGLVIDQMPRSAFARTYYFMAQTDFYRRQVQGLYQQCDDRKGDWIERVLFRKLKDVPPDEVRFFGTQPLIRAVAGSSGAMFPTGRFQWMAKQFLRKANGMMDRRYLWYTK